MDGNKKIALLGSAPIPKALLALGIPMMIGINSGNVIAGYSLLDRSARMMISYKVKKGTSEEMPFPSYISEVPFTSFLPENKPP